MSTCEYIRPSCFLPNIVSDRYMGCWRIDLCWTVCSLVAKGKSSLRCADTFVFKWGPKTESFFLSIFKIAAVCSLRPREKSRFTWFYNGMNCDSKEMKKCNDGNQSHLTLVTYLIDIKSFYWRYCFRCRLRAHLIFQQLLKLAVNRVIYPTTTSGGLYRQPDILYPHYAPPTSCSISIK